MVLRAELRFTMHLKIAFVRGFSRLRCYRAKAQRLTAVVAGLKGLLQPLDLPRRFDAFPQHTLKWMGLPVLTVPFWSRPAFVAQSADAEAASTGIQQVPRNRARPRRA